MNEDTNVKLVEQAYQSVQASDISSFLNSLSDNVLWIVPDMPNVPFAGTWQGHEQVGQFFSRMAEVQDIVEFAPEEFIAHGDKVVVLGRFTMNVKATGKLSRSHWVHVWKVDEGKISYMREYVDTLAVARAHSLTDDVEAATA